MFNDLGYFTSDLSTFGGQVKDMAAGNIPAGASSGCSDMFFSGQYTATRPALIHSLAAPLGVGDILSNNDYPQQDGTTKNMLLYADGSIWSKNVQTGATAQVGTATPGVRFHSVAAFDHFFMAFRSLGLTSSFTDATLAGGDIPLYVNPLGHTWRVTTDAPGGGFSVSTVSIAPEDIVLPGIFVIGPAITAITFGGAKNVIVQHPGQAPTTIVYYTTAQITLASAVTLIPGQIVQLYNIIWTIPNGPEWSGGVAVKSIQSGTKFTIDISQTTTNNTATGGTFAGAGTGSSGPNPSAIPGGAIFNASQWEIDGAAPNQLRTTGSATSSPGLLDYIYFQGLNFNVPTGATITGISVQFTAVLSTGTSHTSQIFNVALCNNSATIGTVKNPNDQIPTTITNFDYGTNSDDWGLTPTTLTPAFVNSNTFGFAVQVQTGEVRSFIWNAFATVFYTTANQGATGGQSLTRFDNIVTAYLTGTTPVAPTEIQPGWYVSVLDTQAVSSSAVPISGEIPFTDNELFQAIFPNSTPANAVPTWIEGAQMTFYTYAHSNNGIFTYNFPGDGQNVVLPAPLATYNFAIDQSVLINPNGSQAGNLLQNAPFNSYKDSPIMLYGVTNQNMVPIRRVSWGSSTLGGGAPVPDNPGTVLTIMCEGNGSEFLPAGVVPGAKINLSGFINPFHNSAYPATGGSDAGSQFVDVNLDGMYTVQDVGVATVTGSTIVSAFTLIAPQSAQTYSHDYGDGQPWAVSGWFFQVEGDTTTTPVWDGSVTTPYAGATQNSAQIITGSVFLPAGNSTFFLANDDGMQIGFTPDVKFVSRTGNVGGGMFQPVNTTLTALNGYPILWAGNGAPSHSGVTTFSGTLTVSVETAGIYAVEIDYVNWQGNSTCCMLNVAEGGQIPMLPSGGPGKFTAQVAGDGVGNVHVTLPTPVENLPIGAWLYLFLGIPSSANISQWAITSNGTGTITVQSTDYSVGESILLGGFTSVKTPQPVAWNGQTVVITSVVKNANGSQTLQFLWTGTAGTGTTTTGTATPVSAQYPSGWVQITQVLSTTEFVYFATNNVETLTASGTVYDYFGSLNTQQSLTAALPGQSTVVSSQSSSNGQASSSGIVQGFQVLSVNTASTPNFITWYQAGFNNTYTGTHQLQVQPQSQIAAGPRNMFPFFINEDGQASPGAYPILVNLNGGTQFAQITLPLGPPGTVARGVAWTPAYGAEYFVLGAGNVPASGGNGPVIVTGTIVSNNTTINTIMDFSDASLEAGIFVGGGNESADAVGEDFGDLTSCIVLPPSIGVVEYNQQLGWWGELNCYPNHSMVNMGMAGGYDGTLELGSTAQPLGWDNIDTFNSVVPDQQGVLFTSSDNIGFEYGFPGTGTTSLQAVMYSPSVGVLATASVDATTFTTTRSWYSATFSAPLPSSIPSDAVLYMTAVGGDNNGMISQGIYQDYFGTPIVLPNRTYVIRFQAYIAGAFIKTREWEVIDLAQPVLNNQIRFSYIQNGFQYDNENGFVVELDSPDFIASCQPQRNYLYAITEGVGELHAILSNGNVPSEWQAKFQARECGCSGPDSSALGQSIMWWMGRHGVQVFEGGTPRKISQWNQEDFEKTNWNAAVNSCMSYDAVNRELWMAFPTKTSTNNSMTYRFNFRLADAQYNVPDPVHVSSYTGRIISTDLSMKQCPVSVNFNSMCMSLQSISTGSGANAFAKTLTLAGQGFGQLYQQDFYNYPPTNDFSDRWNWKNPAANVIKRPFTFSTLNVTSGSFVLPTVAIGDQIDLVFEVSLGAGSPVTLVDQLGTTYNLISYRPGGSDNHGMSVYNALVTVAGTPTVSFTTPGNRNVKVQGVVLSNVGAIQVTDPVNNLGFSSSWMSEPITVTQQSILVTFDVAYAPPAALAGSGFTSLESGVLPGSPAVQVDTAYSIVEAGTYQSAFTQNSSGEWITVIVAHDVVAPYWNAKDADYGTIPWNYQTYFFFSHDTEIQAQIGVFNKIFGFMGMHVSGVAFLNITPLVDSLGNPWPTLAPWNLATSDPGTDYNIGLEVKGNRMALKFTGTPIPMSQGGDGVSSALWLTHLFVSARKDNVFPNSSGGFGSGG